MVAWWHHAAYPPRSEEPSEFICESPRHVLRGMRILVLLDLRINDKMQSERERHELPAASIDDRCGLNRYRDSTRISSCLYCGTATSLLRRRDAAVQCGRSRRRPDYGVHAETASVAK